MEDAEKYVEEGERIIRGLVERFPHNEIYRNVLAALEELTARLFGTPPAESAE